MKKAALYVEGRIVVADSHLAAFQQLTLVEQESDSLVSGFFDAETDEFDSDIDRDHFYNKELLLLRHAQTTEVGTDPPLSERGRRQAFRTAFVLKKYGLNHYKGYTSPFLRCLQTSSVLHEYADVEFEVRPEICESTEEVHIPNRQEQFPQFSWITEDDLDLPEESPVQFLQRVGKVLQTLPHQAILVTHFGVICNMARLALCEEKARVILQKGLPPGSITSINKEELRCLNEEDSED